MRAKFGLVPTAVSKILSFKFISRLLDNAKLAELMFDSLYVNIIILFCIQYYIHKINVCS